MPKMLQDVIVIAKHGDQYIDGCLESLGDKYHTEVIDTSGGGHPTGAYIKAFRTIKARNYLFIQDSMKSLTDDPIEPFKAKMPKLGAVGWVSFQYGYDSGGQQEWVESQYKEQPTLGLFGPIFYTNRETLTLLNKKGLLPKIPVNKLEAQGTERAWACAFHCAGLPLEFLYEWNKGAMEAGLGPFSKTWGNRN